MQYRVQEGQVLDIALQSDAEAGSEISIDEVLMVGGEQVVVGSPTVAGARVVAKVVGAVQGDKIVVFRYKSTKRFRRRTGMAAKTGGSGHRQDLTRIEVTKIELDGAKKAKSTRKKATKAEAASEE